MSLKDFMQGVASSASTQTYVDDVFSTYLYTGNGSTQTINNGIDLAGKGGLVWIKNRDSGSTNHYLHDTARPGSAANSLDLRTNVTNAASTGGFVDYVSYGNSGFTANLVSGGGGLVTNGNKFASWTFRKAAKFFDVVTYTGDGTSNRTVAHSLGSVPGFILVKATSAANGWNGYHRSLGATQSITINSTNAAYTSATAWNNTEPTSTQFTVGNNTNCNSSGVAYVAYLFAHDTSSTGIIQCGSFTTDASGYATVNLGWEPQYFLTKATSFVDGWQCKDIMRGMPWGLASATLYPNTSGAESNLAAYPHGLSPTGIQLTYEASQTYIYMAIRRPNKPTTTGTQVYNAIARTGTSATATVTGVGFAPDIVISSERGTNMESDLLTRLFGNGWARCNTTDTWLNGAGNDVIRDYTNDGLTVGTDTSGTVNYTGWNYIYHFFKRAPGFFDVVCYTGNAVSTLTIPHNLGVVPNLIIAKSRSAIKNWSVLYIPQGATASSGICHWAWLNLTNNAQSFTMNGYWGLDALPTSTIFYPHYLDANSGGTSANVNGDNYAAYLFATLAGISKVGSYTGNGSTQNIECGFAAGARFVLVKRTDSTGDWYVWDTVRGIVTGNDPHLSLNTTVAEVTTDDSIDPYSPGFTVNQLAATNINVTSATYIFLAIA